MELLTIEHQDFTMSIECGKFDAIWAKAVRNVGAENLTSTYSWSDGVASVVRLDKDGTSQEIANGETQAAVFFDIALEVHPYWVFGIVEEYSRLGLTVCYFLAGSVLIQSDYRRNTIRP